MSDSGYRHEDISCMTHDISYRVALFIWNMNGCFMYAIAGAF